MDIIIKSFNRPYYLDRCLFSIQKHSKHSYTRIVVLDDGTPKQYLDKIQEKYPHVEITTSDLYDDKSSNLTDSYNGKIPIDFWVESAKNSSDYFLLLEDDFWFTKDLNFEELEKEIIKDNLVFLKLFWLGNPKLTSQNIIGNSTFYNIIKPKLFTWNTFWYKKIFKTYGFRFNDVMKFLGFYSTKRNLAYYHIYSVAGSIFKKEYFVSLWKNNNGKVDEGLQIQNALEYLKANSNYKIAHSTKEYFQTGFSTAATLTHKKYEGINLDIFKVNNYLNEAWFNNQFDVFSSLPKDINEFEIEQILSNADVTGNLFSEWKKWHNNFKNQYEKLGCKTE
ncbi:glycosyltransferase family 2 protein [Flavobacterium okayamense]|uniref:Glycosyl transferase family 2 n=1 Tax=Flavobacterium okayamense TaxID=2830782 RepID=A0ABN6HY73_9FLAO|nr:hypothetical protein [Flavobacterium okayamense]BCY28715.1 hypothetical protein KK2020170_15830 [Flavobacterium okayamense]